MDLAECTRVSKMRAVSQSTRYSIQAIVVKICKFKPNSTITFLPFRVVFILQILHSLSAKKGIIKIGLWLSLPRIVHK